MLSSQLTRSVAFQLMREAGWAPFAVLVFHAIVVRTPYRAALDNMNHFLGGAAIAFFLLHGMRLALPNRLSSRTSNFFAFSLACTVAVFWEIAEFAGDQLFGKHVQISLPETMWDLIFGILGAAITLSLLAILHKLRSGIHRDQPPR